MRRACCFLILLASGLACNPTGSDSSTSPRKTGGSGDDRTGTASADDKTGKSGNGNVVDLDGLKSKTPDSWQEERPSNQMRLMQFRLPKQKDDERDAELVIFRGFQGTAKQNIERWKAQMEPPEGKKIDDVAKIEELKIGDNVADATVLDVEGTYVDKPPFAPAASAKKRPGYRMIAVQMETKSNPYHIKLIGPAKTVAHYKAGFEKWLKGFK